MRELSEVLIPTITTTMWFMDGPYARVMQQGTGRTIILSGSAALLWPLLEKGCTVKELVEEAGALGLVADEVLGLLGDFEQLLIAKLCDPCWIESE